MGVYIPRAVTGLFIGYTILKIIIIIHPSFLTYLMMNMAALAVTFHYKGIYGWNLITFLMLVLSCLNLMKTFKRMPRRKRKKVKQWTL